MINSRLANSRSVYCPQQGFPPECAEEALVAREYVMLNIQSVCQKKNLDLLKQGPHGIMITFLLFAPVREDTLEIQVKMNENSSVTKRSILSQLSAIYDPLGVISPTTVEGKRIYREVCDEKTGWNSEVSSATRRDWFKWSNQLRNVKVPRSIVKDIRYKYNFTFLPMPAKQRVQQQLLQSSNTPLALSKGCLPPSLGFQSATRQSQGWNL